VQNVHRNAFPFWNRPLSLVQMLDYFDIREALQWPMP